MLKDKNTTEQKVLFDQIQAAKKILEYEIIVEMERILNYCSLYE